MEFHNCRGQTGYLHFLPLFAKLCTADQGVQHHLSCYTDYQMTFIAPRRLGSDSLLGVIGADMGTEQSTSRIFDTEIFPGHELY